MIVSTQQILTCVDSLLLKLFWVSIGVFGGLDWSEEVVSEFEPFELRLGPSPSNRNRRMSCSKHELMSGAAGDTKPLIGWLLGPHRQNAHGCETVQAAPFGSTLLAIAAEYTRPPVGTDFPMNSLMASV